VVSLKGLSVDQAANSVTGIRPRPGIVIRGVFSTVSRVAVSIVVLCRSKHKLPHVLKGAGRWDATTKRTASMPCSSSSSAVAVIMAGVGCGISVAMKRQAPALTRKWEIWLPKQTGSGDEHVFNTQRRREQPRLAGRRIACTRVGRGIAAMQTAPDVEVGRTVRKLIPGSGSQLEPGTTRTHPKEGRHGGKKEGRGYRTV